MKLGKDYPKTNTRKYKSPESRVQTSTHHWTLVLLKSWKDASLAEWTLPFRGGGREKGRPQQKTRLDLRQELARPPYDPTDTEEANMPLVSEEHSSIPSPALQRSADARQPVYLADEDRHVLIRTVPR